MIDGVNIKDYDLKQLRSMFGLVQQEPVLFNETINYNIKYSDDTKSKEQVLHVAEVANATDFIKMKGRSIDEGLEFVCGMKGSNLSGGQK